MPTTPPVNLQQILQMGTHVEKLQQVIQHQPITTAQQMNEERKSADEVKRTEVQDSEPMNETQSTDPDSGSRRREVHARKPSTQEQEEEPATRPPAQPESLQGWQVDLKA